MFESASTHAMIAVKDLDRAKQFYGSTLGLATYDERPGAVRYETQGDTRFMVYESNRAVATETTRMKFEVEDIEVAVKELRDRGIVFEECEGVMMVDGIATHESGARGAFSSPVSHTRPYASIQAPSSMQR